MCHNSRLEKKSGRLPLLFSSFLIAGENSLTQMSEQKEKEHSIELGLENAYVWIQYKHTTLGCFRDETLD